MIRRLRVLSGLLAVVAMSLSLGEGLWAATCAPMDPGVRVEALDSGENAPADCAPSHHEDGDEDRGTQCPFAGFATFGACVSAAVQSPPLESVPIPPESSQISVADRSRSDRLLASSLFRPPRA